MDHSNLKTASTYVNNLLLARGLLRNGKPVDFARLAASHAKKPDSSNNATITAQVINLVHDLVLRKDVGVLASSVDGCPAENSSATRRTKKL